MATGLPLLTYGLAEIGATGSFTSLKVIIPCIVGPALVAAFVLHALRVPKPLLDMRLYRKATFSSASFAMFCLGAALFGGMILLPLYWQEVRLESVVDTGLLTAPQGLGAALAMPIAGKLTDRWGGGGLALFGVILCTVATIPFGLIGAHTSIFGLSVAMFVRGIGIGFGFLPAMAAAFAALERSELSSATPQLNVIQRVGGSIGTAILAVVLQRALVGAHGLSGAAAAYGTAFWVSAGLTAAAIIPCVILMRAERAARAAKGGAVRDVRRGDGGGDRGVTAAAGERLSALGDVVGERDQRDAAEEVARSFKRALAALRRMRGREAHCPGELTDAQYSLLFCLRDQSQLSLRDLADAADLSPASVTEMLEGLAAAGLVERHRSDRDRRVVLTSLTDGGRGLVEERRARFEPRLRAALEGFSEDELVVAASVLERLRDLFEQVADERRVLHEARLPDERVV